MVRAGEGVDRYRLQGLPRRGRGVDRRQRRRQVDADQRDHRRPAARRGRDPLRGKPVNLTRRTTRAGSASRPFTRTWRSRRISIRSRTSSSAAKYRSTGHPRQDWRFLDDKRMRADTQQQLEPTASADSRTSIAAWRPCPAVSDRASRSPAPYVGQQGRDHGRADGRARRRAIRHGAGPDRARSATRASRSSSSATTCRTSSRSPTGSWCCGSASWSRTSIRRPNSIDDAVSAMTGSIRVPDRSDDQVTSSTLPERDRCQFLPKNWSSDPCPHGSTS